MKQVLQFLKDNPTYYLATIEGGKPRVRPFGSISEHQGRLYFCTSNKKDVFKQMIENSYVEISTTAADGSWLRVAATAVNDPSDEAKLALLADIPGLGNIFSMDDGVYSVLYLKDATATFHLAGGEQKVVTF